MAVVAASVPTSLVEHQCNLFRAQGVMRFGSLALRVSGTCLHAAIVLMSFALRECFAAC